MNPTKPLMLALVLLGTASASMPYWGGVNDLPACDEVVANGWGKVNDLGFTIHFEGWGSNARCVYNEARTGRIDSGEKMPCRPYTFTPSWETGDKNGGDTVTNLDQCTRQPLSCGTLVQSVVLWHPPICCDWQASQGCGWNSKGWIPKHPKRSNNINPRHEEVIEH